MIWYRNVPSNLLVYIKKFIFMKKILILASGSGSNAEAIVKSLNGFGVEITIGCNRKNAGIWERLKDSQIIYLPSPENDFSVMRKFLLENDFDLIVMAGYMRILPSEVISIIEGKTLNIHPSLLPKYKGSEDGYKDAFENQDEKSGCTVHWVTDDVDGGPVVAQLWFEISTAAKEDLALLKKVGLYFEHQLYPRIIKMLLGLPEEWETFGGSPEYTGMAYGMQIKRN